MSAQDGLAKFLAGDIDAFGGPPTNNKRRGSVNVTMLAGSALSVLVVGLAVFGAATRSTREAPHAPVTPIIVPAAPAASASPAPPPSTNEAMVREQLATWFATTARAPTVRGTTMRATTKPPAKKVIPQRLYEPMPITAPRDFGCPASLGVVCQQPR